MSAQERARLEHAFAQDTSLERRDRHQNDRRVLGYVVQCDGARAVVAAHVGASDPSGANQWTVGKLISISLRASRIVGLVYRVEKPDGRWNADADNAIAVHVELIGEVRDGEGFNGGPAFDRGITAYPHIGALAHRIRAADLQSVYEMAGRRTMTLGQLSQDETVLANVAVDDMLTRHFAVVGTTGVGKSTAVSLILRKAMAARPDLRVLVLDPHNEFAAALGDHAVRVDASTLELPFWMFRLEELCEVLFRGRDLVAEEVDILRDLIPTAKHGYRAQMNGTVFRRAGDALSADTPVPYRMADLLKLLDERLGMLDSKPDRSFLRALKARIESCVSDPNYRFMFQARVVEDAIQDTIATLFRIPVNGRPITCFEMAGLPAEVVNSVCSVLARLAFDIAVWSEGRFKLLVLCEEAHRYMPADPRLGFAPTRYALSRIAKEGRKYGCYLGIVTQRPGELDPTVLSQCSTVFAMRLANEQDQAIIRSAIADSSASTLSFLSAMGQREAVAFGEAVATTMRLRFERVEASALPGSNQHGAAAKEDAEISVHAIVERLRHGGRSGAPDPFTLEALAAELGHADEEGAPEPRLSVAPPPLGGPEFSSLSRRRSDDLDFDSGYGLPRGGGAFGQRPRG